MRKAEIKDHLYLLRKLVLEVGNIAQYLCGSSIKSQKEKQKEDQSNRCSHSLRTISACGQPLPLLLLPRGHGGWTVAAGRGHTAEQRSVKRLIGNN